MERKFSKLEIVSISINLVLVFIGILTFIYLDKPPEELKIAETTFGKANLGEYYEIKLGLPYDGNRKPRAFIDWRAEDEFGVSLEQDINCKMIYTISNTDGKDYETATCNVKITTNTKYITVEAIGYYSEDSELESLSDDEKIDLLKKIGKISKFGPKKIPTQDNSVKILVNQSIGLQQN